MSTSCSTISRKAQAISTCPCHRATGWTISAFAVRIETLNIASRDTIIFTERVDYLQSNSDPSVVVPLPVTGVMEVREGKIVAWRDYLDLRTAEDGLGITIRPVERA